MVQCLARTSVSMCLSHSLLLFWGQPIADLRQKMALIELKGLLLADSLVGSILQTTACTSCRRQPSSICNEQYANSTGALFSEVMAVKLYHGVKVRKLSRHSASSVMLNKRFHYIYHSRKGNLQHPWASNASGTLWTILTDERALLYLLCMLLWPETANYILHCVSYCGKRRKAHIILNISQSPLKVRSLACTMNDSSNSHREKL